MIHTDCVRTLRVSFEDLTLFLLSLAKASAVSRFSVLSFITEHMHFFTIPSRIGS